MTWFAIAHPTNLRGNPQLIWLPLSRARWHICEHPWHSWHGHARAGTKPHTLLLSLFLFSYAREGVCCDRLPNAKTTGPRHRRDSQARPLDRSAPGGNLGVEGEYPEIQ